MRRKKLLRQVAAAAVALSMAVSLSAPAFAAEFNLANGGLVITANDDGITVTQEGQTGSTSIADNEEIVVKGTYNGTYNPYGGATLTAEENQQDENQPVTPAKAPAKEETSEETQGAENAPAAEEKQEQKDTENLTDPEQKTETENKDNNSDPDNEEKKEQNAPANGELNASAGEGQESKAEDEDKPKTEAKASAEASTSASDDASNGSRKAPARSSGEKSEIRGIIQIFANTLVKLTLKDATIDQPNAADTSVRGRAAIDIQGSGDVEITVKGYNTLKGCGGDAGIQKNDNVSTGTLTITAEDKNQTLNVIADVRGAAIGGSGWGWNTGSDSQHGTKNIEINGGTVNTQGRIGGGYKGGAAENIVITGDAVVNANGGIGGGSDEGYEGNEGRQTSITISGNAQVNATYKVDTGSDYGYESGFGGSNAGLAVIGGGVGSSSKKSHAKVTIQGNATIRMESRRNSTAIGSNYGDVEVNIKDNVTIDTDNATVDPEPYNAGSSIGGGDIRGDSNRKVVVNIDGGTNGKVKIGDYIQIFGKYGAISATEVNIGDNVLLKMKPCGSPAKYINVKGAEAAVGTRNNPEAGGLVNTIGDNTELWYYSRGVQQKIVHGKNVCTKNEISRKDATCTEDGWVKYECTYESDRHATAPEHKDQWVETIPATGHHWKDNGNGTHTCTKCGATEALPADTNSALELRVVDAEGMDQPFTVSQNGTLRTYTGAYDTATLTGDLDTLRYLQDHGAQTIQFVTNGQTSSFDINDLLAQGSGSEVFYLTHRGAEEPTLLLVEADHSELVKD